MQLTPGDRVADSAGEWEVVGRPYTTAGGKNARVRVQRVNQPGVTEVTARVSVGSTVARTRHPKMRRGNRCDWRSPSKCEPWDLGPRARQGPPGGRAPWAGARGAT